MKIAILGHGKMGREVERQATLLGHEVAVMINTKEELQKADLSAVDFAVDFTEPDVVVDNINFATQQDVNMVVGTTGWYDQLDRVKEIVREAGTGFLWSANFSVGVNIYWKILEQSAKILDEFDEYDVFGHEYHHNKKKDSPSGTTIKTAQIILDNIKRKDIAQYEKLDRAPFTNELHFSSTRGGSVPGTHKVFFDSDFDTIEITHSARNRSGWAIGAIKTGEWLSGKHGVFSMDDYINDIFN